MQRRTKVPASTFSTVLRGEIIILNTGYCWWLQGVSTVYTGVSTVHCLYIQGVWTENCWCVLSTGGCWPEPSLCTIIDNLINYICISATVKHSGLYSEALWLHTGYYSGTVTNDCWVLGLAPPIVINININTSCLPSHGARNASAIF